jgi:hypothetical protein
VRCTWKRSYVDSPSRYAYENVSSAAAPRSLASPIAARKSDCITHGVDGSARYAQVTSTASFDGGPAGSSAARGKSDAGPHCIEPRRCPSPST